MRDMPGPAGRRPEDSASGAGVAFRRARSAGRVVRRIEAHLRAEGGPLGAWYVGVAARPGPRLFEVHRVAEAQDWWIWEDTEAALLARAVARYFHELGCQGDVAWDDAATSVYAYRAAEHTVP